MATAATTTTSSSHKSATSPMQQDSRDSAGPAGGNPGGSAQPDGKRSLPKGAHVRFSHVEVDGAAQDTKLSTASPVTTANNQIASNGAPDTATTTSTSANFQCRAIVETCTSVTRVTTAVTSAVAAMTTSAGDDSSESETDNNDETGTTDKFLLLVDQLSLEQPAHLSIKDIGIILDRLNSKVIDVAMLERQVEASDTHNWTIKATIRGEVMRELGVIYNNNYYAISEHPEFNFSKMISSDGGTLIVMNYHNFWLNTFHFRSDWSQFG